MAISVEDRLAIHELLAQHGHLVDAGEFDRMHEVFVADVVYDLTAFGLEPVLGREALCELALKLGDRNPVGHHVTNVVITAADGDRVEVKSKGIGINADGTSGSVVYDDVVRRTADGWRLVHRRIAVRRTPLVP